jgi:hypothetical protein
MGPLWVRANQDPSLGGEWSARLSGLADNFEGATRTERDVAPDSPSLTDEKIAEHLEGLERSLVLRSEEGGTSHAPA